MLATPLWFVAPLCSKPRENSYRSRMLRNYSSLAKLVADS